MIVRRGSGLVVVHGKGQCKKDMDAQISRMIEGYVALLVIVWQVYLDRVGWYGPIWMRG